MIKDINKISSPMSKRTSGSGGGDNRLVLFLGIFTILIVVVAYFQFRNAIYAPFGTVSKEQISQEIQQELSALVFQDTDSDGLTDFDEQFVYNTSAYIVDTDSDAYSDKEEVDAGSNPLDPKSTPYTLGKEPGEQTQKKEQEGKNEILEKIFPAPEVEGPLQIFKENLSGQEIRDLLIQFGIDRDIVDKLDDKTLIKLYNETVQETTEKLTAPEEESADF